MTREAIIVKRVADETDPAEASAAPPATGVEPSLLPPSQRLLRTFPVAGLQDKYVQFLEQRIQRNPRDLHAHVQRVLQCHAKNDTARIYGALLDLFLILGARGQPLRHRLLGQVADQLSRDQHDFLASHLETGLLAAAAPSEARCSKLSKQVTGTTRIVVRRKGAVDDSDDLLALARESIAHGQSASARSLLEGALELDPGQEDVCRELLALYVRNGLRTDFFRTYTSALGRRLACPELWERTAAEFEATASEHED